VHLALARAFLPGLHAVLPQVEVIPAFAGKFCVPSCHQTRRPDDALILGESNGKDRKTADRKKVMDTTKSTDCPKCGKPTRIVKRVKDRERDVPGGIYISCSACEFYEKL